MTVRRLWSCCQTYAERFAGRSWAVKQAALWSERFSSSPLLR
jgi:hypothetical protein